MDRGDTAQDMHRCDFCDTAIVHSYCDFCHVNLCKSCIGEHISDDYDKHSIVPFLERRSTLIYPKCELHPHKNCNLQCKDCNVFVFTFCIGSKQHKEHDIWILEDIYNTKKENIKNSAEELQNLISPTYEEMAYDLETQIANLNESYERLTTDISKQGEIWHTEIDIVINKMKTEIGEIKVKHGDILQKHLDEIKQIQSLLQEAALTLKEVEESNELSFVLEHISKNSEFRKLPPKVKVSLPAFILTPVNQEKLHKLFGQITPLSTSMEPQTPLPKKHPNTFVTKLLDEPKIYAKIQTFHSKLCNIAFINDGKIWTSGETGDINYINTRGLLLQTTETKSGVWPSDIAVGSDGNLLYSDWKTRAVYRVKNEQTEELIRLKGWVPCQLCVTSTGDLLVTMFNIDYTQSKVVRYSGSTEKQTIQFDDKGKPLYSGNYYIKYVTENRNNDICVADCMAGAIVVVNQAGKKLRWRYTGHPSNTKSKQFEPYGITTDSQSRVLTADANSQCIHILDQNGQFLCYIDNCHLKKPKGVRLDNDGDSYVCEYASGNVKKIKYFKVYE